MCFIIVDDMIAVAVDEVHGFLYWSDYADTRVKRAKLDGTNLSVVYHPGVLCCLIYQLL